MLDQEIREKRKAGSGIFSRVSTRKGGVTGGIRFAKHKYKKYEKNSKVKHDNVFENIISYEKFITYSKEMQKEILEEWLYRFSKEKIKREMQISDFQLQKLIDEFKIEKESSDIMKATNEEMERIKNADDINNINRTRFKLLPDYQKFEIVDYWQQQRGIPNKDIAQTLGYETNSFNTKKSLWKKEYLKQEDQDKMVTDFDDDFLLDGVEKSESPAKKQVLNESESKYTIDGGNKTESATSNKNQQQLFKFKLNGTYTGDNLNEKAEALKVFMDSNKKYNVVITIEEVNE